MNWKIERVSTKKLDYTKWLGEGYSKSEKYSTVVMNHTSYIDIPLMDSIFRTTGVSKAGVKGIPLVGRAAEAIGTIFVERTSKEDRHKTKEALISRQQKILDGEWDTPIGIFPEGTVTNGSALLPFKPGAFISETPVKPVYFLYSGDYFQPTYDSIEIWESLVILWCQFSNKVKVIELPVFNPTEHLFREHKELGASRAEIYAEAVRRSLKEACKEFGKEVTLMNDVEWSDIWDYFKLLFKNDAEVKERMTKQKTE